MNSPVICAVYYCQEKQPASCEKYTDVSVLLEIDAWACLGIALHLTGA